MADRAIIDPDVGRFIETTKRIAATRQIEAAIVHFRDEQYECAMTLAGAAEGLLPPTEEPHIFLLLKGSPTFKEIDYNLLIAWLKHPTGPDKIGISEFETAIIIMRAISKLFAVYGDGTEEMRKFGLWVYEVGHMLPPEYWNKKRT